METIKKEVSNVKPCFSTPSADSRLERQISSIILSSNNQTIYNGIQDNKKIVEEFDVTSAIEIGMNLQKAVDSVDNREKGLNVTSIDFFDEKDKIQIKNIIQKEHPDMSEEEVELYLHRLKEACNQYSIDHGCGAYSLLAYLNGGSNRDISKENFFGHILLNGLGADRWYEIMNKKLEKNSGGPITATEMNKILSVQGYSSKDCGKYDAEQFDDKQLLDHLKKGNPAIIMVGRKEQAVDYDYAKETMTTEYDKKNIKKYFENGGEKDNTWAKSSHYILLTGADENGKVNIVDARSFGDENFSHIRQSDYKKLKTYISSNEEGGKRYSKYAGCILIDL